MRNLNNFESEMRKKKLENEKEGQQKLKLMEEEIEKLKKEKEELEKQVKEKDVMGAGDGPLPPKLKPDPVSKTEAA